MAPDRILHHIRSLRMDDPHVPTRPTTHLRLPLRLRLGPRRILPIPRDLIQRHAGP